MRLFRRKQQQSVVTTEVEVCQHKHWTGAPRSHDGIYLVPKWSFTVEEATPDD